MTSATALNSCSLHMHGIILFLETRKSHNTPTSISCLQVSWILAFEMDQTNMNAQLIEDKSLKVDGEMEQPTVPNKIVSILLTRFTFWPFIILPDAPAAFVQSYNKI